MLVTCNIDGITLFMTRMVSKRKPNNDSNGIGHSKMKCVKGSMGVSLQNMHWSGQVLVMNN